MIDLGSLATMSGLLVRGRLERVAESWDRDVTTYGHFTSMQVRAGRTRGLDLHARRMDAATRELFDVAVAWAPVCALIREALGPRLDASVRVYVSHTDRAPLVTVTVRPPAGPPTVPQRLRSVHYQRPLAHVKHLGGFKLGGLDAQTYFRSLAQRDGFDDALLTGPRGAISESTTANIAFLRGSRMVWPDAPALQGITMQLVERGLAGRGVETTHRRVTVGDLASFEAAFLTNARGVWPIAQIDDVRYGVERAGTAMLDAYESAPWDEL